MATLLASICLKYNRQDLIYFAIPAGFLIDFGVMFALLSGV